MSGTGSEDESGLDMRAAIADAIEKNDAPLSDNSSNVDQPPKSVSSESVEDSKSTAEPGSDGKQQVLPLEEKPLDPHANWSKDAKDRFGKLDKPSQEFLLDRERSMQADYTKKTQEIAALKRDYEPVEKLFSPYRDQMKASGQTPHSLIEGWANVEKALMNGKGVDVIRGIVQGYKLDPKDIVAALNGSPAQPNNVNIQPQQAFQIPPEIQAKLQKIDQFESRFQAEDQARTQAETAKVMQSIEDFKGAKDGSGNALHPHFDELEADMATLAQVMKAQGHTPTLDALYEKAVYANPSTRAKVLAADKQAEEKRVKDEARAKAEKARKASGSVTGSPSGGSGQPLPNGRDTHKSLRDQIAESYSELAS